LKAQLPNDDGALFPNQFVNVRMLVDTREDAITVPSSSIQRGAQGLFVYVVNEDQTVSLRSVKTGVTEGTRIEIETGVKARERVVIDGMDRLRDGMKVEIAERRVLDGKDGEGKGKGKGRRGKGGEGGDAAKGDAAKGDANKGETAKGEKGAAKDDGTAADPDRPRRKKPPVDGAAADGSKEAPKEATKDATKDGASAAKGDAASADAPKGESRKRGDGSWRKKKDAEAAAQ